MATTIASGTFSTAISSTSGSAAAVSTVKRPLPQPSSTRSSFAPGSSSRQRPRRARGSATSRDEQASIRGSRFFFFLMRIAFFLPRGPGPQIKIHSYIYHKIAGSVNEKNALFGAGDGFVTGL